ncbi:hypothetical protein SDC9_15053 [bioreactor metagenome]|uniref:Uncharacterized protein n=1 Tax=bioreactor metagenome TaxID=1076179 RepID=A0A644TQP1_9ZZZZ|nr:YkuS family protein [Negativicutes bacterium]
MPKTIALHSTTGALAKYLTEQGYQVIDYPAAERPGVKVDAILCTGYRPDMIAAYSSLTERVDISLGNIHHDFGNDHAVPVNINITGMSPEQVRDNLYRHLERHHHCHS